MWRVFVLVVALCLVCGGCQAGADENSAEVVTSSIVVEATSTSAGASPAAVDPVGLASVEHVAVYSGTAAPDLVLELDPEGLPVVVFVADREGPHERPVPDEMSVRFAKCLNADCSDGVEAVLLSAPGWIGLTGMALTTEGSPVVAYSRHVETEEEGPGEESKGLLICRDAVCDQVVDVPFSDVETVAVTAEGYPVVAHHALDGVELTWCLDELCDGRVSESVPLWSGEGGLAAFRLGDGDLPWLVRQRWGPGAPILGVTWCVDPACGSFEQMEVELADSPIGVGQWTFALDNEGLPIVAHTGGRIAVATCSDDECNDLVYSIIGHGQEAEGLGFTVTSDNRPVLVYPSTDPDRETWFLNVAVCDDPACITGSIATIADHGTLAAAVAIDDAGNPVVGHVYWSMGETNIYHCVDPQCETGALQFTTFDASGPQEGREPIGPSAEGWVQVDTDGGRGALTSVLSGETLTVYGTDQCDEAEHTMAECPIVGLSDDGIAFDWYRSSVAGSPMAVARIGDTVVVTGQRCSGEGENLDCTPIAWTLTDGEWEIVEFPCDGCAGLVDTIGTWDGGLIAFGVTNDGGGLWHSPDGYQWTRHSIDGLFGPIERFYSFVEADELRAYGASCVEEDDWQMCEGALWTSTDGVAWQRDDRITGLETHEAWGLEDSTTGYLMAGWTCPEPGVCDGAIMYSTDGLNWQDYAPTDAPGDADRIVEMDGTIIGLGMLYDEYWGEEIRFVAETSDMSTWTYTEIPKELGRFGVNDLAVFNNMIYAVGIDSEDRVAIWTRPATDD
jgi:hypothetical protein